jgi:hypothetical protein
LLEGSTGKIGRVILVNLEPLTKGATEIEEGFVEVWKYDKTAFNDAVKRSYRSFSAVLYLPNPFGQPNCST